MANNHTPNYGLNQWERSDKVIMEEFNADNAAIDAAIHAVMERAEEANRERIYTGTFVGDGQDNRVIELPWAPKFMLLLGTIIEESALVVMTQKGGMYLTRTTLYRTGNPYFTGSTLVVSKYSSNLSGTTMIYVMFR